MPDWLARLVEAPPTAALAQAIASSGAANARGAAGSSTALVAGALAWRLERPLLLVVAHLEDADEAAEELAAYPGFRAERFGALEAVPGEGGMSLELLAERLRLVEILAEEAPPDAIVAPIQALMQAVPEPGRLDKFRQRLEPGAAIAQDELLAWLEGAGYSRVDAVEQPGDFAVRGGIVDVYAVAAVFEARAEGAFAESGGGPVPVRVDLFGDEIDTLTAIDLETMGSGAALKRVELVGAAADSDRGGLGDEGTTGLLELLPPKTFAVLDDPLELSEQGRGYQERLTDPRGTFPPKAIFDKIAARPHARIEHAAWGGVADSASASPVELPAAPLPELSTDPATAIREVAEGEGEAVILADQEAARQRIESLIAEHAPAAGARVTAATGYLHRGFAWRDDADAPLALIPEHELFHRYGPRRRGRARPSGRGAGERASDVFLDVEPGDPVVHEHHGVAKYQGLETIRRAGRREDVLTLEFAQQARLRVPATQAELVQKYVGGFQGRPPLSVLGGKRWRKQKEAVSEAVRDLAAQMLQVQAARAATPGIRFPEDSEAQETFEALFPHEETDDQLAAIAGMKRDMADGQPMDRLICGDVGFGKTEVAVRGAFKAMDHGKQVAVLVPTTVLAEQHERTFRERLAGYPYRIESLTRFKSAKEQRRILKAVATGQLDLVVGTHRLLSADVGFHDLGLVIVDEEQRFGVEHKQKLLELRTTADVLTLTATPIPRTLHMSLLGLRQISSLSTPPADRRSVVTEVIPYDEQRIERALRRELAREGQVYFVHNRVHNIDRVASEVKKLAPEARVAVAHGQMKGRELERVMLAFVRREIDVLVCTTIIESGLDIPTANTMIVTEADHYGLADLHQLRGRIGRWKHRAYCYLLLPRERVVSDRAAKRLKAIESYSMLGAGFRIAMRDLELRGAGNLLGPEQSGHIATVGYEMYCKLLDQAARRLRDESVLEPVHTHLELPVEARLPAKYVPSEKQRLNLYKRLGRATTFEAAEAIVGDVREAYGDPPASARSLFALSRIRIAASALGVESLKLEASDLIFRTRDPQRLAPLLEPARGRATVVDQTTVHYRAPEAEVASTEPLLETLERLLVEPMRPAATPEPAARSAPSAVNQMSVH